MRHQIAIIVLILAAATAANAAEINCTSLMKPNHNFYEPTGACTNDTTVAKCLSDYDTCVDAAATCTAGFLCVSNKLRCLEAVTTPNADCASWIAMLGNEKLYIAAGGEYNGSTLELSCRNVVCAFQARKNLVCPESTYRGVCVDPFTNAPTAPAVAPPGAVKVTFTISGDRVKFAALLATESGRRQAFVVVGRLLVIILNISDPSDLVVTDVSLGSLVVEFYTTDPNLSVDSVRQLLNNVNNMPNKAELFQELADLAGIPVSELGVSGVEVSTQAPLTPDGAASFAAVAAALAAAVLAMLL